jgi:hypothetical protein
MILETIRAVTDWLNNATYGVNAKLSTVTRDGGDPAVDSIQLITDETRNFEVAIRKIPATPRPNISVFLANDVDMSPKEFSGTRNGDVTVIIRYAVDENNTNSGLRDAYYTMRAVIASLKDFNSNGPAPEFARSRNGVQIIAITEMVEMQPFQTPEDTAISTGLRITFEVRDTQP